MVLLLIEIALTKDHLEEDLNWLDELLNSVEYQAGYCCHSVSRDLRRWEQLMLVVEWKNEVDATNYLNTEAFRLLKEAMEKVGENFSASVVGVLSRGEIETAKTQASAPSIFEAPHQ